MISPNDQKQKAEGLAKKQKAKKAADQKAVKRMVNAADAIAEGLAKKANKAADKRAIAKSDRACTQPLTICPNHGYIHGAEAEELRSAIEAVIAAEETGGPRVTTEVLQELLDRIDARDSCAFAEAFALAEASALYRALRYTRWDTNADAQIGKVLEAAARCLAERRGKER